MWPNPTSQKDTNVSRCAVDRDLATNHAAPKDLFARHADPPFDFLILGKTETDRPLNFWPGKKFSGKRNTHLYVLGAFSNQ